MKHLIQALALAIFGALLSGCAAANTDRTYSFLEPVRDAPAASTPMPTGLQRQSTPAGFISFCMRFADQCAAPRAPQGDVILTAASWNTMGLVDDRTNSAIAPEDDREHYGRAEYWDIPMDGRGNCKDYALTKRKLLTDAGFPSQALRIAIVLTGAGERHVVLTVTTNRGDYVLDNLTGEIRPWSDTGYAWIERQSGANPRSWVGFQGYADDWRQQASLLPQNPRVPPTKKRLNPTVHRHRRVLGS